MGGATVVDSTYSKDEDDDGTDGANDPDNVVKEEVPPDDDA